MFPLAQEFYFLQMGQEHLPPLFPFRIAQRTTGGGLLRHDIG